MLGLLRRARLVVSRHRAAIMPGRILPGLRSLPRFLRDRRAYVSKLDGKRLLRSHDLPQLSDWTDETPFEPHYTYQDGWAARKIREHAPERHVDVGSRLSFAVGLAAFVPVTLLDLRPARIELSGIESQQGSILDRPYSGRLESFAGVDAAGRFHPELRPRSLERSTWACGVYALRRPAV